MRAPRDFYFRYHDKPLVVPYINWGRGELKKWSAEEAVFDPRVKSTLDEADLVFERYRDALEVRPIRPYRCDLWSYIGKYPQQRRAGWMSASPGVDPFLELAYHAKKNKGSALTPQEIAQVRAEAGQPEGREDGAYYVRQLSWAKDSSPDILFVSGWNDWQYGCQIEPAKEYRFLYVDLTAKVLGRWAETQAYRDGL